MSHGHPASTLAALAVVLGACSFGTFQTAHTEPPGDVLATVGVTHVMNGFGQDPLLRTGLQSNLRVGVTDNLDMGLGSFMRSGGRLDAKLNVLAPTNRLALAPRLGIGARLFKQPLYMAEAGVIGSYRALRKVEPYLGLAYANHWVFGRDKAEPDSASRTGIGNGVLQGVLGVDFDTGAGAGLLLEYGHWWPLNNDPGDFYAFTPADILGVAVRFGGPCR